MYQFFFVMMHPVLFMHIPYNQLHFALLFSSSVPWVHGLPTLHCIAAVASVNIIVDFMGE